MFFSLNKKFLYTIAAFFIIAAVIFLSTFYNVYYNKILEEQRTTFARNQQYISSPCFMKTSACKKSLMQQIKTASAAIRRNCQKKKSSPRK